MTEEDARKYLSDIIDRLTFLGQLPEMDNGYNDYVIGQLHAATTILQFLRDECDLIRTSP